MRNKTAFRQAALQRHLTAFKADLVKAAGARLLSLVAAPTGLAETRADAASDAPALLFRPFSGFDGVQPHRGAPDPLLGPQSSLRSRPPVGDACLPWGGPAGGIIRRP